MLCNGPEAEFSEELCEGGGQVVGIEAAGVGENPGVATAKRGLLEADPGVFNAGDDAVRADADEGDDRGPPAFDLGLEALAAGAKFVVGEFISAGGGAFDDVGDTEFEVQKKGIFKRREDARGKAAAVESGPEPVARSAKVAPDGGGVQPGVNAREEDDKVFGYEIRDELVVRGQELGFGGFPRSEHPIAHRQNPHPRNLTSHTASPISRIITVDRTSSPFSRYSGRR